MPTSLDALKKFNRNFTPTQESFDFLKRKGVYPYNYVDSVDKLAETTLPPKEAFLFEVE